ncbi:MAG TPA: hypothetical protein VM509_06570, partial [Planctomycetota bacterium]|nr:hypothetical protein [Planctomycetota bacterium]
MKSFQWGLLALLLVGGLWLVLRGPDITPERIEAVVNEKPITTPAAEPSLESRRPIDGSSVPIAPALAAPSISINAKVVDASGAIVTGAEVWFRDGQVEELQGVSDSEGLIVCASAHWRSTAGERSILTAQRNGFAPGSTDLSMEPMPQPIEIVLRPAWTVTGRVVGPLDSAVGAGFSVAAIRSDSEPNIESFRVGKRGASWVCAEADLQGRFALDGLDRERSYQLVAWGPAFIPDGRKGFVSFASGGEEPVVQVTPVYGCRFNFVDAQNGKVRTSPLLWFEAGGSFKKPRGFTTLDPSWPYLRLAQVPERLLVAKSSESMSVIVTPETEREVADSISGVGANLRLPGYEPRPFEAEAPLARGECAEHEVTLVPSASGLGSIRIHLANFPKITAADLRTFATSRLFGVVVLNDRIGSSYAISVQLDCGGEVALDAIPAGTYRVWFRDTFGFFQTPKLGQESTQEIIAGQEAELSFELPPHGQVVLFSDDGVEPRGPPLGFDL